MYKSELIKTMVDRGYLHQCTDLDVLDEKASKERLVGYIGFDCTAPSLHVGSLVQIMLLHHLQQTGHKPIVLLGGGTTRIGDPSGKDKSRQLLTDQDIANNKTGIRGIFSKFLTFGDGPTDAIMLDNDDWLRGLEYISFLRDYGRHFSVNRMLTFDSVKLRLEREQPLTFLEFNYMILQAYDFVELFRRHGCTLQLGGSDQWGNIVNGVELGRRVESAELFGLTSHLITTSSGAKMGKTAAGAVWLNADALSPYDYWQYWRNTEDADVVRFLKMFTSLSLDEIDRLGALEGQEINEAKKRLATEATKLAHGEKAALEAEETARKTFEEGRVGADLPRVEIPLAELKAGVGIVDLLRRTNLSESNKKARKLVEQGGAKLNGSKVPKDGLVVTDADINSDGVIKVSSGKKNHAIVVPT